MCGLGDAICYVPFLRELRAKFPQAEIVVLVATSAPRLILESSAAEIQVIVLNRSGEQRGWRPTLRLLRELRRRKFDVVISGAHPDSPRIPLFAFLSGIPIRIGSNSERLSFLYNRRVDIQADAHYFDRYRLLLSAIGIHVPLHEYRPTLEPPLEARESAMRIWHEAGLTGSEVVIGMASGADVNPRGSWMPYLKRWNTEGYAKVAVWATRKLAARVVMFGGVQEAGLASEIASISGVPVVNLCGKTGLGELQWLIRKCSAVVSNDTGIMHMAGALGTQVVALFGPTSPDSFRPPGKLQSIVQGSAPCSPCYPHPTCGLETCHAMNSISASQVIDGISSLLT